MDYSFERAFTIQEKEYMLAYQVRIYTALQVSSFKARQKSLYFQTLSLTFLIFCSTMLAKYKQTLNV